MFTLNENHFHNFHGFPKNYLSAYHCTIDSFEGIPEDCTFRLEDCTIRSLGGVSRATLQTILVAILSVDYDKYDKFALPSRKIKDPHPQVRCRLDLPPTGLTLFDECIDHEIENRFSPKYHENWPWIRSEDLNRNIIPDYFVDE